MIHQDLKNLSVRFQILGDEGKQEIARHSLQEHTETRSDHEPLFQMKIEFFHNVLSDLAGNALVKRLKRRHINLPADFVFPLIHKIADKNRKFSVETKGLKQLCTGRGLLK